MPRSFRKVFWPPATKRGVSDNPNVEEFQNNTQALRVVNSVALPPKRGNCRGNKLDYTLNKESVNKPLPKRPRKM